MILLDTCAALWSASSPKMLRPRAANKVAAASRDGRLFLSSISAWEIATLVRKNRLGLETSAMALIDKIFRHAEVVEIPVDREIAATAGSLANAFQGDPADRLIVATSIVRGIPVMTGDARILSYAAEARTFRAIIC